MHVYRYKKSIYKLFSTDPPTLRESVDPFPSVSASLCSLLSNDPPMWTTFTWLPRMFLLPKSFSQTRQLKFGDSLRSAPDQVTRNVFSCMPSCASLDHYSSLWSESNKCTSRQSHSSSCCLLKCRQRLSLYVKPLLLLSQTTFSHFPWHKRPGAYGDCSSC